MKTLLTLALVVYTVHGFSFSNISPQNEEISSQAVASCEGVADGTRLPDEEDCGKFTLCDNGLGLHLSCRSSAPHFDRCASTCVDDIYVCEIAECPGDTTTTGSVTTTEATTQSPGDTTTTTSPPGDTTTTPSLGDTTTTTTPLPDITTITTTTTTAIGSTTTAFTPPTVPNTCEPPCTVEEPCTCLEQMVCLSGNVCECDESKMCPVNLATCSLPENCGCEDNCECSDAPTNDLCTCKGDSSICTFDRETECVERCGCDERCDISVCEEDVNNPGTYRCTGCNENKACPFPREECLAKCGCSGNCDCNLDGTICTCFDDCQCVPPPDVCPFEPTECATKCGCDEKCVCNGPFCMCDPDGTCPAP